MGIVFRHGNWWIRVNGDEHPPTHCHVIHPDGEALIYLDGRVVNRKAPRAAVAQAREWVARHPDVIRAEWDRLNG